MKNIVRGSSFVIVAFVLGLTVMAARRATAAGASGTVETNGAVASVAKDGTGNLSKQRRDALIEKIGAIRKFLEKSSDTNAVQLLAFAAELEKEVRTKKYGLVFEEHKERVDVEMEKNLPVLTENKKRFIDNGGELNFLIEGDNLAALKLLEKTHKGKVDLIYIDPPYNTGNKDFVYNDSYVDATDTFRHSKWLSFMKKRLEIAKKLLSKNGILFISIDDNEQAGLRLLCDEDVLGDDRFVGTIAWESKTKCQNTKTARKQLQRKWEYILCYKSHPGRHEFSLEEVGNFEYDKRDEKGEYREKAIEQMSARGMRGRETMIFPILGVSPRNGQQWKYGKDTVEEFECRGDLELIDGKPSFRVRPDDDTAKCRPFWSFLDKSFGTGESAKTELKEIIGENDFETVKPHQLIEYLVARSSFPNSIILDFFAGSGTTGHAVMNLNAADDKSHRQFILVTDNENGICEKVTYERLKRVIAKEDYKARLKYFKIDMLPIDEKVYYEYADDLLKHIRELVELENGVDFGKDKSVAIVLTDKDLEKFVADEKRLAACKTVYVGHNVLVGGAAKRKLAKCGIEQKEIPQYYYPELED